MQNIKYHKILEKLFTDWSANKKYTESIAKQQNKLEESWYIA